MYGILTDDAELARSGVGDVTYFFAERVDGRRRDPVAGAINSVACWGDTAAVEDDPARAAVDGDGTPAAPGTDGQFWGTVCPTDPDYRSALLDRIERVGAVGDVRLTTLGFPGAAFCRCDRCERRFEASDRTDRGAWRAGVITRFVADVADRVGGDVEATLHPDPYPGHLRELAGTDPRELAPHVDGFLVPLCDLDYATTYWAESLARGFASELDGLDASLTIQLSALDVGVDRLVRLGRRLDPYADCLVFGASRSDVDDVGEAIRRLRDPGNSTPADRPVDRLAGRNQTP